MKDQFNYTKYTLNNPLLKEAEQNMLTVAQFLKNSQAIDDMTLYHVKLAMGDQEAIQALKTKLEAAVDSVAQNPEMNAQMKAALEK